jgi:hypothetical protein
LREVFIAKPWATVERAKALELLSIAFTAALAVATVVASSGPIVGFGDLSLLDLLWPLAAIAWAAAILAGSQNRIARRFAWILMAASVFTILTLGYPVFFILVIAGPIGLVLVALTCMVLFGIVLWRSEPHRRLWFAAPLIVVATFVLLLSGIPTSIRFAFAEPALSAYARQLQAGEAVPPRQGEALPISVGSIPIYEVRVDGGELIFITSYVGILDDYGAGLAYVPTGTPAGQGVYQHLQGSWYIWTPY